MNDNIEIWCDGGCRGNSKDENIGGWGAVLKYKDNIKELYDGERNTTNNIQELKSVINALQALKTNNKPILIYCDSQYVVNGITKWIDGWKKRGWRKSDKKVIENLELWKKLDELVNLQQNIQFIWVKGHADNEGNNRADELANIAMDELKV